MPSKAKLSAVLSIFCALILCTTLANSKSQSQQTPPAKKPATSHASTQKQEPAAKDDADEDDSQDTPDDELAPAATTIDVSNSSPLIERLYEATRLIKEDEILAKLDAAQKLIDSGADVKAVDSHGRTALHWAVFGSSYSTKPKVLVEYEAICDSLLAHGVEINREDVYQDTALDYLLYAPTFEVQTLLIEHGASSGFLAAFYQFFNDRAEGVPQTHDAAVSLSRKADLTPGQTLSIRLDVPVYSDRSRTGDPVTATVTYPLCKTGEQVSCKEGELLIPPGTRINGTVLFAQKAPNKYARPRLVLDFANVLHKDGTRSPLYARVLDVDNARETIRNNEILGIIQPHASKKAQIAMAALGAANPIAGYTIKGVQTVYGLSIRREVMFPIGTDIQIQIVRPTMLKQKELWSGWPRLEADDELHHIVNTAPMRTTAKGSAGTFSDPTNLMFLGSRQQLEAAFGEAGWFEADSVNVKSAIKVATATMRQTGYNSAPMSTLLLQGRPPDLVFQKSLDTFAKRHHLRIWKLPKTYQGQEVWIGAATHDIATDSSRAGTKWLHRIDPHVDRERDWVQTDLLFVGTGVAYVEVERPTAPKKLNNATGDEIVTDGKVCVVKLAGAKAPEQKAATTATPK